MSAPWRVAAILGRSVFCGSSQHAGSSVPRCCLFTSSAVHQYSHVRLQPSSCNVNITRRVSFFNQLTGEDLWKSVGGVSNAGRKRGRGKRVGKRKATDLNRGQVLGTGKVNMLWPGLNSPVIQGRSLIEQKALPPNPDREAQLVKIRDQMSRTRYPKMAPLVRGWSGNRFPGQSIGQPDAIGDYKFADFDTRVLEFKLVTDMTGTLGKKFTFSAFVVCGNSNGIAGYGLGRAQGGKAAIRMAKNRAAQNLMFIPRFEDHTVYHNMYAKFHKTKIFIRKKEEGFGLRAHRVVMTICKLMGIQDLHCKVEGSTKNVKAVTKGFFEALVHQETHQHLADRMNLHVVERRQERLDLPVVVASPSNGLVSEEKLVDEDQDLELDYDRMYVGGKVELHRPDADKRPYYNLRSHRYHRAKVHKCRNQPEAQIMRLAGQW